MSARRALPDMLAVGPMKAGTTWLHEYLYARGDVCLPTGVKETYYFDRHFAKGETWYAAHFAHFDGARHRRIMEVGSSYFHCPDAPERIRRALGPVRVLVTVRDPVRRSWSHYLHLVRYGYTAEPLRVAVARHPAILEASRYVDVLERWWRVFGEERVQIALYEDLVGDPHAYARGVCTMLDLRFSEQLSVRADRANAASANRYSWLAYIATRAADALRSKRLYFLVNAAKRAGLKSLLYGRPGHGRPPALADADREWLASELSPQVESLAARTRRDLSAWLAS